jgi:cytochrome b involved in lipid metabolism
MKNKEIIFWTIMIALIGGMVLFVLLNKNQTSIDIKNVTKQVAPEVTVTKQNNIETVYTMSDVSKHDNQSSCWTIINGKIYDITSFISSHPAGVNKILQGCGVDATNMYGRVGVHDISRLTNAFVGNLKQI